jgi:KUP system potassium uptake protein
MSTHQSAGGTTGTRFAALALAALGVVYGDIGTSPLYAVKEVFAGNHPIPVTTANIYGSLSLFFWALIVVVSVKYVTFIMRADNRGEGGIMALIALALHTVQDKPHHGKWIMIVGVLGAAMFYGDGMVTPAISVLSAVEGLEVGAPALHSFIIPITIVVLFGLFFVQKSGTAVVGAFFGPVMLVWFSVLALLGIHSIIDHPEILMALNPLYGFEFLLANKAMSLVAMGNVVLAVTGAEALYADMGHFGRKPISRAWFAFVLPALVLNYMGQGAAILADPAVADNPFYRSAPDWALYPLIGLATLATVIASQAVISGAFSVARQSVQMGLLPRMQIIHTSGHEEGQIYVPFTNWSLYLAVVALVIGFRSSSNLAAAYGIAVTGTMLIDTILVAFVMVLMWKWHWSVVAAIAGFFLAVDVAFFAANAIKIPEGGWFPIAMGLVSFTVLTTWRRGRRLVSLEMAKQSIPMDDFITAIDGVHRINGTAVFMTSSKEGVPPALLHNLKHNQVLHERVVLVTVQTADTPHINDFDRIYLHRMGKGFMRLIVRYGFMESPDIPAVLDQCKHLGERFDMMETTFYLSRETIVPSMTRRMTQLRARLFSLLTKNATSASDFFQIPTNRVVELGTQLVI